MLSEEKGESSKSGKSLWKPLLAAPALFFLAPLGIRFVSNSSIPDKDDKSVSKKSKKTVITAHGYMNERAMERFEGLRKKGSDPRCANALAH
ncbi:hypothetical protein [Neobacillus vireti]|uniref:Uncharacterized protein n=1 Tax=Neobacillus vireti LMG 21834 TaxID=1131730 RepID=A0AB94IQU3_9BACI|nr:hypothetical protein [Neobacillus vireti]ETI69460.1 hypothetical protein BAVI_07776 [Neobacillus vireti LMG 21834]KLT18925.1 hypothetical protein AA980_06235 [Neobacillus vireti]